MKRTILLLALGFMSLMATGQNNFQGEIEFQMSYDDLPAEMEAYKDMLPNKMMYYVKGSKLRTEVPSPMSGNQIVLFDIEKNEGTMLMDLMGQKQAISMSKEYIEAEEKKKGEDDLVIDYKEEYKEVAGYKCQKALITQDGKTIEVFYTPEIKNVGQTYKNLKGLPLEFKTPAQNGISSTITALRIEKKEVDESLFLVPEGYTKTTIEEFMKMYGGQ